MRRSDSVGGGIGKLDDDVCRGGCGGGGEGDTGVAWRVAVCVSLSRFRVPEIRGNKIRGSRFSRVESRFLVGKDYSKTHELHVPVVCCAFP